MINGQQCNFVSLTVSENAKHNRWKHYREGDNKHKFLKFFSCLDCKEEIPTNSFKAHINKHDTDKIVRGHCLECAIDLFNNNKFCSSKCAAKYNNARKDYSNIKVGPPKGYKPKNLPPRFTKIKQCEVCGKFHKGLGRSCSKECKSKILSIAMNKRIDNGWNPQEHRCRSTPSFLEKSFEEWLISINYTDYVKNKTFRCGKKIYYGDFFFPNTNVLIELDGKQHKESIEYDSTRDKNIMEYHNVKTIRISHKEYMNKSKVTVVLDAIKYN